VSTHRDLIIDARGHGMPTVSGTKDFDEAVDAAIELAVEVKAAMKGPHDPATIAAELLSGVSDGKVRGSLQAFVDAIEALKNGHEPILDLLMKASSAILELIGHLRDALADGHVTPDEIVSTITDGHLKAIWTNALDGIGNIPDELTSMSPWAMIGTFQRIMGKIMPLLSSK
jgi:hypothetical protein